MIIPVPLGRQKQDCTETSRLAWPTQQIPSQPGSQSSALPQRTRQKLSAWPVVDGHKPETREAAVGESQV